MEDMSEWSPETGENPKKALRPYHKPDDKTRQVVEFYRSELDTGAAKANLSVARSLYGRATSGKDTIASIFWLKARADWVDTPKSSHDSVAQNITVTFALEPKGAPEVAPKVESELIDVTPREQKDNAD